MNERHHVPPIWAEALSRQIPFSEAVQAWAEPDLDSHLHFAAGLLALTDQRLVGLGPAGGEGTWMRTPSSRLRISEHAGAVALELHGPDGLLQVWWFTVRRAATARALAQAWNDPSGLPASPSVCPRCGAMMAANGRCPPCDHVAEARPVRSLLRLFTFARPYAGMIALGLGLALASTAAGLVPPYLTMPLMDRVLIPHQNGLGGDFSLVPWYLGSLLLAAAAAWLLDWARSYVSSRVADRVAAGVRQRTYAHLQTLSLEYFGGKRTGDLISRLSSDTDRLCNFLSVHLVDFLSDVLMITMTAIVLLTISPILALATLAPFPLILGLVIWVRERLLRGYRASTVAWGEMTSVLADTIPGIRVVKAFAQEHREVERFHKANRRVLTANDRLNLTWSLFAPVITFLTTVGLLVVWAFAAWQVYLGAITVGVLTAFLAYISRFYSRSEAMIRIVSHVQRATASAQRLFEILDRVPSVPEPTDPITPKSIDGRIELKDLRFRYGSREVLHGIDLTIEPGELIGLVGPSGAGKSTLVNLVCRFYDVAGGAVLVDGVDVRRYPVTDYRRHIGIVLQEPFLFFGTVAENIAYGRPEASRDEIVAAARAAHAHDFIMRLTDGYDSLVGERGQALSGGERQRISIARALLIDPRILILDEATSSVDTETERDIQAALENLIRGRTTIAIAHRLSTLRKADRIVVLDQGRITEVGTHSDLLDQQGTYARLHHAQMELVNGQTIDPRAVR